jgi:MATE family multidrug resistance protein
LWWRRIIFVGAFAARAEAGQFEAVYALTVLLLRFVAFYSLFDALNIIFASAIKGAGDTRFVMATMLAASVCILAGPTYVAIVTLGLGLMAAWVLASIYVTFLGVCFFLRFRGGKWKAMRVIEEPVAAVMPERPEVPGQVIKP